MDDQTPDEEDLMDATTGPAPAPLPPPSTGGGGTGTGGTAGTVRMPLRRSRSERWLAGVAGGLAEHFNVDPLVIRGIFVVLLLTGAIAIPLYIAGWILIPEEGSDRAVGEDLIDRARNSPSWVPILLIGIGAAIALGHMGWWGGPMLWAAMLIGGGILLYRRTDARPSSPPPDPPDETQPGAGSRPAGEIVSSELTAAARTTSEQRRAHQTRTAQAQRTARAQRRRRSHLGRLTVASGLVVMGVIAMLHNAGVVTVSPRHYPAIAMVVIGTGLLIGSLWGRSRGLIFLGLLAVPFALTASLVSVPLDGGTGERSYTPSSGAETRGGYHLVAGQINVDLSRMVDWSQPVRVDATVAFGEIDIHVPADVRVKVSSHAGAGSILLFGNERTGTDVDYDLVDGSSTLTKTLVVDARVSFGQISLDRQAPAGGAPGGGTTGEPLPPGTVEDSVGTIFEGGTP